MSTNVDMSAQSSRNGTLMCPDCGVAYNRTGLYAMRNHERHCLARVSDTGSDEHEDEDNFDEPLEVSVEFDVVNDPVINVVGVDDFDHLTQFLQLGRCVCTDAERQLVQFVHMAQEGYGVSRHFSETMLKYSKASGGLNVHLPDTWKRCVEMTTDLVEKLEGKRKTFCLDVPIPDKVRALLADPGQTHIAFEFECPITEMIRIAMFSETCQSFDNVAFSYEENDGYLDDFCNGDRYKRIAASISPGGAILGAVLATDGICMDKCMFDSQEVSPSLHLHCNPD